MDEKTLREGVARLLAQCEKEEASPRPQDRFLFVHEILCLLGLVPDAPLYAELEEVLRIEGEEL